MLASHCNTIHHTSVKLLIITLHHASHCRTSMCAVAAWQSLSSVYHMVSSCHHPSLQCHQLFTTRMSHFLLQGPEVRSGDLAEPIPLERGQSLTFTITEGEADKAARITNVKFTARQHVNLWFCCICLMVASLTSLGLCHLNVLPRRVGEPCRCECPSCTAFSCM